MKKVLGLLTIVALSGLIPVQAQADTPGCVAHREFRRVEIGMRQARVIEIFDTNGDRIDLDGETEEFAYDTCPEPNSVVFVTYVDNHVTEKSWVRGE